MQAHDLVTTSDEDVNVLEEFQHIDTTYYDFENCDTALDPIGPIVRRDVYAALVKSDGNLKEAALLLNRPRESLNRWLKANKDMMLVLADLEESFIDDVETLVKSSARAGDGAQQRYLLSTKGKNRGYSTRVEATGKDGSDLEFARIAVVRVSEEQMMRVAREYLEQQNATIPGLAAQ